MDSSFLVLSREHHLLPLAHRLRNIEHHETEVVVWKRSYENAWAGMIEKDLLSSKREIHAENIDKMVARALSGEIIVCHDVPTLSDTFKDAPWNYPSIPLDESSEAVRIGGWWDGTGFQALHLLVYDMGAWPSGMGRWVPGAVSLIRVPMEYLELDLLGKLKQDLIELLTVANENYGFKGLFNVGINDTLSPDMESGLELGSLELGWPHIHTQAFMGSLAEDARWKDILRGEAEPTIAQKYTVAIPVSVPPYPSANVQAVGRAKKDLPINLNPALHKFAYWHDVMVNKEEKALYSAGLDGLICAVHASANVFEGARLRAIQIASSIAVEEKQFRMDAGLQVPTVLAGMEERYGVIL